MKMAPSFKSPTRTEHSEGESSGDEASISKQFAVLMASRVQTISKLDGGDSHRSCDEALSQSVSASNRPAGSSRLSRIKSLFSDKLKRHASAPDQNSKEENHQESSIRSLEGMKERSRRLMRRVSLSRDHLGRQPSASDPATASLKTLAQSSRLFPAYLCLNHRGWQIVPVNYHAQSESSSALTRPVRGFEAVWLADQDELAPATKDWTHFSRDASTPPSSTTASDHALFKRGGQGVQTTAAADPQITSAWCLASSSDGRYVAAGSKTGFIFVWEVKTFTNLEELTTRRRLLARHRTLSGHTGGVIKLEWSVVGDVYVLVSCAFDSTVRVWTLAHPGSLCIIRYSAWPIGVAFVHKDCDDRIIVSCLDGSTQVLTLTPPPSHFRNKSDPNVAKTPAVIHCQVVFSVRTPEAITHLAVSPDGQAAALGTEFGKVRVIDTQTGDSIVDLDCRNRYGKHARGEKVTGIDWSESGFVAVTSADERIRVVNTNDARQVVKFKGISAPRLKAAFDPSYRFLIGPGQGAYIFIWDVLEAAQRPAMARRGHAVVYETKEESPVIEASTGITSSWVRPISPSRNMKRPTAAPVASFKASVAAVSALLTIPLREAVVEHDHLRVVQIVAATSSGLLLLYVGLLSC